MYDEKKAESLKTLDAAEAKKSKMVKTLEGVDGRLEELREEMGELREYQEKERDRKALEYAILSKELEDITKTLENVSSEASYLCHGVMVSG